MSTIEVLPLLPNKWGVYIRTLDGEFLFGSSKNSFDCDYAAECLLAFKTPESLFTDPTDPDVLEVCKRMRDVFLPVAVNHHAEDRAQLMNMMKVKK
jgi:hypothetical protein